MESTETATVLPSSVFINPIVWVLDADIDRELQRDPAPPECPAQQRCTPLNLCDRVIRWTHTLSSTGHPGTKHTVHLIAQKYWWPHLAFDVFRYGRSCSLCATPKSPCHLPVGKLVPLPVPQRPWSHIAVDFVTALPVSEGHTVILVVVHLQILQVHTFY